MIQRHISRLFAKYLKEKGAYSNFIKNTKGDDVIMINLDNYFFDWNKTPQGFNYWYNIYCGYAIYMQENIN